MSHEPMPGEEPMFPPQATHTAAALCAWCAEPAVAEVELEKPRYTVDKLTGVRLLGKHAITARVCATHQRSLRYVEGREPVVDTDGGRQR